MARGINKVTLIGRLGKDPECKTTQTGMQITNISIATTETYKDKQGQKQEVTDWHNVTFFGKLAEIAGKYLSKGSMVYVEGKLKNKKWVDQTGANRYATYVVAHELQMMDSKPKDQEQKPDNYGNQAPSSADDFQDQDIPF